MFLFVRPTCNDIRVQSANAKHEQRNKSLSPPAFRPPAQVPGATNFPLTIRGGRFVREKGIFPALGGSPPDPLLPLTHSADVAAGEGLAVRPT